MTNHAPRPAGFLALLAVLSLVAPARAEQLSEREAVLIALERNPGLGAAALGTEAARRALEAAGLERTPVLRAGVGSGVDSALGQEPDPGGDVSVDLGLGWTSAVGTSLDVGVAGSWSSAGVGGPGSDANDDGPGSLYGAEARLQVTQPLLRGAGRDVGEASVRAARLSVTAAEQSHRAAASQLVNDVLAAYWELWYAQQALGVHRAALELAERQLEEAETRVSALGTMPRTEALRFATELASIEESLAQAESEVRTRSAELGRLLGLSATDALALETAGEAPDHDLRIAADEAVALARAQSHELLGLRADLVAARDRVEVARDATLPRLDLTTTLSVGGLWGAGSALVGARDGLGVAGLVGLSLELPIRNGRAVAQLGETRARSGAAELQLAARELAIETQAVTGVERLETARRRAALAERSVGLARALAEAEGEALRLGTSTAFQALEAQASLRGTELRRLRALVDRAESAISLQHLTGQLLPAWAERSGEP